MEQNLWIVTFHVDVKYADDPTLKNVSVPDVSVQRLAAAPRRWSREAVEHAAGDFLAACYVGYASLESVEPVRSLRDLLGMLHAIDLGVKTRVVGVSPLAAPDTLLLAAAAIDTEGHRTCLVKKVPYPDGTLAAAALADARRWIAFQDDAPLYGAWLDGAVVEEVSDDAHDGVRVLRSLRDAADGVGPDPGDFAEEGDESEEDVV